MSNSKYIRLQELVIDTFNLDAPVEIEKGALLLESTTKTVLLQLRLNVLDNINEISSTSLNIYGFTDSGEPVEGFSPFTHTYTDVYLQDEKTFGDRTPIILDSRIRRVNVEIDKVVFRSGDVWRNPEGYFTPPTQMPVSSIKRELLPQFEREISNLSETDKKNFQYIPHQFNDYWLCTCGRPNKKGYDTCSRCGLHKEDVFHLTDEEYLRNNLQKFIEETRIAEEERKTLASRNRRKLTVVLIALVVIGSLLSLFLFVIQPALNYSHATSLLTNKDFDGAILAFTALEEYKDSSEMVKESTYQKGLDLHADKMFDDSIIAFTSLGNYKDSSDMVKESTYQKGLELLDTKWFNEAIVTFSSLADYKDSSEMVKESTYQRGLELLSSNAFDSAILCFSSLVDYKDSSELLKEATYQKANSLLLTDNFSEAIELFEELKGYKESDNLSDETMYLLAKQFILKERFGSAIGLLEQIPDYKDSIDLLQSLKYKEALTFYEEGEFTSAQQIFQEIKNYKDSKSYLSKLDILIGVQGTWEKENSYVDVWYGFKGWHYYWKNEAAYRWYEYALTEDNLTDYGLSVRNIFDELIVFNNQNQLLTVTTNYEVETYIKTSEEFTSN